MLVKTTSSILKYSNNMILYCLLHLSEKANSSRNTTSTSLSISFLYDIPRSRFKQRLMVDLATRASSGKSTTRSDRISARVTGLLRDCSISFAMCSICSCCSTLHFPRCLMFSRFRILSRYLKSLRSFFTCFLVSPNSLQMSSGV